MASERPILIVDDDTAICHMLRMHLELDGQFSTTTADSVSDAISKLDAPDARFDAVILDVGLPDGNGYEFCSHLRTQGRTMPIILLTGWAGEGDVARGLDAGANDYIVKPFRIVEFRARLRAQLRVFESSDHAVFSIGPYTFQPALKLLRDTTGARRINLTEKESGILKYLYRAASGTVARSELLQTVWGYRALATTHTLETHIYRLRQKMEQDPANPRILLTEHGGYRLNPTATARDGLAA